MPFFVWNQSSVDFCFAGKYLVKAELKPMARCLCSWFLFHEPQACLKHIIRILDGPFFQFVFVCVRLLSSSLASLILPPHLNGIHKIHGKPFPFQANVRNIVRSMSRASARGKCTTVWVLDISNAWRGIWRRSSSYTMGSGIGQVTMGSGLLDFRSMLFWRLFMIQWETPCVSPLHYGRERIGSPSGWLLLRFRVHLDLKVKRSFEILGPCFISTSIKGRSSWATFL